MACAWSVVGSESALVVHRERDQSTPGNLIPHQYGLVDYLFIKALIGAGPFVIQEEIVLL